MGAKECTRFWNRLRRRTLEVARQTDIVNLGETVSCWIKSRMEMECCYSPSNFGCGAAGGDPKAYWPRLCKIADFCRVKGIDVVLFAQEGDDIFGAA